MKKLNWILGIAIITLISSCGGSEDASVETENQAGIKISGEIIGASGEKVTLWVFEGSKETLVDSTTAIDNSFTLYTDTKELREYVLDIGERHEVVYLFPDENSGEIVISGDYEGLSNNYKVTGDENSQDYAAYWQFINGQSKKENQIYGKLDAAQAMQNEDKVIELNNDLTALHGDQRQYAIDFINKKPHSPASWIMLQEFYPPTGVQDFDTLDFVYFQKVSEAMKEKYPYSNYPTYIDESIESTKAQMNQLNDPNAELAPDLAFENPDGKVMKLSDMRGKVVLLDFWASWCGPCRMENPNVVKVYEKYKNKGFTVFSVSLDTDKDKWVQAIKNDNLSWPNHVSDLMGWKSSAAAAYGVNSIPATFLISKEGKIIDKNLRGGALEQKLQEILG